MAQRDGSRTPGPAARQERKPPVSSTGVPRLPGPRPRNVPSPEVPVRQQRPDRWLRQHGGKEPGCDPIRQQPVAPGEAGGLPHRSIHVASYRPRGKVDRTREPTCRTSAPRTDARNELLRTGPIQLQKLWRRYPGQSILARQEAIVAYHSINQSAPKRRPGDIAIRAQP